LFLMLLPICDPNCKFASLGGTNGGIDLQDLDGEEIDGNHIRSKFQELQH